MSKPKFDNDEIQKFLEDQRDEASAEAQGVILDLEDFWDRKLWHQLTEKLLEFFASKDSSDLRLQLYKKFILSFAEKINQLKLVKLALAASREIEGRVRISRTRCGN